ncbi:flagellar basal body L-ring protein [Falsiroseomonas bella]|uniref:Flagellar L-ring protein n=1 Tax=Falsiroseomonas bella TaxID=2184016 RepID=A0A317FDY4_9PROT|nr:flagellar basal body L-ring protein FlgH [Falsiroseomonas bella]PWS36592.1 flagellar basal body L-ring protein [Falsiroseomonas bella]
MNRSALLLAALVLAGCERLSEVGRPPVLAGIENPTSDPRWRQVSMPMPALETPVVTANSLWRPGSRTFLRDQRAAQPGDLVTILVSIQDRAQLNNETERERLGTDSLGIPRILGLESSFTRIFPNTIDPSRLVETRGAQNTNGSGSIRRNESVTLRVAATVAQVLPNGNLVVTGRQQVRVNSELRDLTVSGVIRPQDISSDNTVRHDRLAEARIAYGGRGTISDVQRPRYGQEVLDTILPF